LRRRERLPLTTSVGTALTLKSLPSPTPAHTAWLQQDPGPSATSSCRLWLQLRLHLTVARHCIGIGFVTRFPATAPAPTPPHGCVPLPRHRLGYPIPRHGTRFHTLLRRSRTPACAPHFTLRLHATAPALAWLPDSSPRHPLPHNSSAVARSGVRSPLHLTVARHGIDIGFVTRFPTMALTPTSPHGCALRHRHRLGYPIPRHSTHYLTTPRWSWAWSPATTTSSTSSTSTSRSRATASASAWFPDSLPRHKLTHNSSAVAHSGVRSLLHLTVARHSISIGLVIQFPATAPATSQFLGGHGLGPPLLPPTPPPPPHGCEPRHRHRLGYPVLRYGTYLTLPRRPHAPASAATLSQRARALAFAAPPTRRSRTPARTLTSTPPSRRPHASASAATPSRRVCAPASDAIPLLQRLPHQGGSNLTIPRLISMNLYSFLVAYVVRAFSFDFLGAFTPFGGRERWEPHGGGTARRSAQNL
jgi:hypothetical protein